MEREGDCTTDSRRESIHSCAEADQVAFEHLKQENERLKADNDKLRRENKELHARLSLPKSTMPTERGMATLKMDECCLRMEFAAKTGELAACFKGAFQLFYRHLRSKLNKKIKRSVKKLEEDADACLKKLKEIDAKLARHRPREAHSSSSESDSDSDTESPEETKDQIELKNAKKECRKIIEELKTSFEKYNKLFSAEDMPVSPAPTVTGTDVGRVECQDFLLKIDEMCGELAECKMFFAKLHDAVMFTLKQKEKFRPIHKLIDLHEITQHSEVDCVQETREHVSRSDAGIYTDVHRGDDFDDIVDTIGCFRDVSKELSEGSSKWHKSMREDTLQQASPLMFTVGDMSMKGFGDLVDHSGDVEIVQNSCEETLGQNLKGSLKKEESLETDTKGKTCTSTVTVELPKLNDRPEVPDSDNYQQRVSEQQKHMDTAKAMPTASDPTSESSSLTGGVPAPSPKTVKAFLEFYQQRLLGKMVATAIGGKLLNGKVIPKALSNDLESKAKDNYDANTMLFQHAEQNFDFEACLVLCDTMKSEEGYPKMNKLGEEMWRELKENEVEYRANDL